MRPLQTIKRIGGKAIILGTLALLLALTVNASAGVNQPKNLHMVSVGIAQAEGQSSIPSCKKDALDMDAWARSQKGKLFEKVDSSVLINEQATRQNTLRSIQTLKGKVQPGDYTMVYLSSHGGCHHGEFAFCAYDKNIRWSEIQEALRDLPGTVIVILDTCHAGAIKDGGNLIVISSSLADQGSYAGDENQNSLFTEYLLAGLNGAADMNKNGIVSLAELDAYMSGCLETFNAKHTAKNAQDCTILRPTNVPSALPLAKVAPTTTVAPAAQPAVAQPAVTSLAGTTWSGTENLGGYGKLTFRFLANGKAVMIDARNTIEGSYQVNGSQVTITLPGAAVYTGRINGTTLSGEGRDNRHTWTFSVTKSN